MVDQFVHTLNLIQVVLLVVITVDIHFHGIEKRKMMNDPKQSEAHIVKVFCGHLLDKDCWCEPSKIHWETDPEGKKVLVIEHEDISPFHHRVILHERTKNNDWITRELNEVGHKISQRKEQ